MTETTTRGSCALIRPGDTFHGKQGFDYFAGISAERVGAKAICMHLVEMPPGGRAKAHLHEEHETAIYVFSGQAEMWHGEGLTEHMAIAAGDFVYIPAGVPHLPANASETEPCVAVLARTDPNEQESVVLRPDLDGLVGR
jgi:uncharacterized RmlC-like cupin family protein